MSSDSDSYWLMILIQSKISMRIQIPDPDQDLGKTECVFYRFVCSVSIVLLVQDHSN
jgi:hypothetical protein